MNKPKHIILIGFKHVGKTTLGRLLAQKINSVFFDSDKEIELLFQAQYEKQYSCRKIMQIYGADFFKALETKALKKIIDHKPAVIAVGGGTPMSAENQTLMSQHLVIHITGDPNRVFQRIMKKGLPPFFPPDKDPYTTFQQLWEKREQVYRQLTNVHIKNNGDLNRSVEKIYYLLLKMNALTHAGKMTNLLLVHGPNLNILGKRDPEHYGNLTLKNLEQLTRQTARKYGFHLTTYQSNHEGYIIDTLQAQTPYCAGIIINPGALTHYSYALHDALADTQLPIVEVHLSQIDQREAWRSISVTSPACIKTIWGKKELGYIEAVEALAEKLQETIL